VKREEEEKTRRGEDLPAALGPDRADEPSGVRTPDHEAIRKAE
jgi:hypothetical protein